MAAATPKIRLIYFDIKARAEPTRLAFTIAGVPFEDVRVKHSGPDAEWPKLKPTLPLGQVPVLEVDGKLLAQSYAILGYAGRLAKLHGADAWSEAKVDEILYTLQEIDTLLAPSGKEQDAEKKKKLRQDLASGPISTLFGNLEKLQKANGGDWLVGQSITIADLAAYCKLNSFVRGAYDDIPKDILSGFPGLVALYARVEVHPKVKAWNEAHA